MPRRIGSAAAALTAALAAASCGWSYDPQAVRNLVADTSTYPGALTEDYVRRAEDEAMEGDWRDADVFLDRARQVAAGEEVGPEPPEMRTLPADATAQADDARLRLISALDRGGRIFAPEEAARAQTAFDCWLQELEEDHQPLDILVCRSEFEQALRRVIELTTGDIMVLLPDVDGTVGEITVTSETSTVTLSQAGAATLVREDEEPPRPPVAMDDRTLGTLFGDALAAQPEPPARYLLYFEVGGATLTPESAALLPEIEAEIRRRAAANVTVIGHTDTVGPAGLNARLAVTRAQAIREMLLAQGVDAARIDATSYGESLLLIQTPDNTDEPLNRRVEVIVR